MISAAVVVISANAIITIQFDHCFIFRVKHSVYLVTSYHVSPEIVNMNNRLDDPPPFDGKTTFETRKRAL